jgi:chemotaxis protein CheX
MNTTTPNLIDEMRDSIKSGVSEVFKTMLSLEVKPVAVLNEWHAPNEPLVAGSVGFTGDANGVVYLHVTAAFARTLASRMLGLPEAELGGDDMVNDVVGELSNMVVGCAKSRLCDAGAPCVLTIPSIVRGHDFSIETACRCNRSLLGFRCGVDHMVVELLMEHRH